MGKHFIKTDAKPVREWWKQDKGREEAKQGPKVKFQPQTDPSVNLEGTLQLGACPL